MVLFSNNVSFMGCVLLSLIVLRVVIRVLYWLYVNLIGPKLLGANINFFPKGSWAVITGATDGIGKSYAKALAKRGLNLILISRSLTKLEYVAKRMGDIYDVKVKIIDVDFTSGPAIYNKIKPITDGLIVSVLVNNVGKSYPHPEYFLDCYGNNEHLFRDIINVNIHSVTNMCRIILPGMVEKRKGIIINLSSTSAVIPSPLLSVYSGTKAFVDKFSQDLQTEYQSKGILVQNLQPGFVTTKMTKIRAPTTLVPSADEFVESALNTLGFSNRTTGYFPHTLLHLVYRMAALMFCDSFSRIIIFKHLLSIRNRSLRNLSKQCMPEPGYEVKNADVIYHSKD